MLLLSTSAFAIVYPNFNIVECAEGIRNNYGDYSELTPGRKIEYQNELRDLLGKMYNNLDGDELLTEALNYVANTLKLQENDIEELKTVFLGKGAYVGGTRIFRKKSMVNIRVGLEDDED
ncbi:MAG: hypothetical protein A2Y14_00560 [Verrucomicrobia bacterium GWF2_51_19]|nr:MAG: hypothetical protein A2Y14_00560 [Verrucomicrobia bacterium GWF2_51_19]